MRLNTYRSVQPLRRPPVTVGGMCSLTVFKWEDADFWPLPDPRTGIITTSVRLRPGKNMLIVEAVDRGRTFEEELKYDGAGPYFDIQVEGIIPGNSAANLLTLESAAFHRFGIIVKDRSGVYRLVGNKDSGARINYKYSSGDVGSSRKTIISWAWQNALAAPPYQALLYNILIGGISYTAGILRRITGFVVGDAGAPMTQGTTTYTNALFTNKRLLVLADGFPLPCDDGTVGSTLSAGLTRHFRKTVASANVTIPGGAVAGELLEFYEIDPVTADGTLRPHATFVVGALGSPMANGATIYNHSALTNKKVFVVIDGVAMASEDSMFNINWTTPDNSLRRRFKKTQSSTAIVFLGGVKAGETIDIYEIN